MSSFLKLTSSIINTKYITKITISESEYFINMFRDDMSGFLFGGSGFVSSTSHSITVCQKKNLNDYNIVKKWIDKLDNHL